MRHTSRLFSILGAAPTPYTYYLDTLASAQGSIDGDTLYGGTNQGSYARCSMLEVPKDGVTYSWQSSAIRCAYARKTNGTWYYPTMSYLPRKIAVRWNGTTWDITEWNGAGNTYSHNETYEAISPGLYCAMNTSATLQLRQSQWTLSSAGTPLVEG